MKVSPVVSLSFFLFDLSESFWTFHGRFQFLQVPWYENQCFIMSKLVYCLLGYRLSLFILKTTFSRGWAGLMTKLMAEPILHVFLVPHEYCMKSFLGHHKNWTKKFCCNICLYWNHVMNELT